MQSPRGELNSIEGETLAKLRELEESLWRSETRFDDALMDQIFADDFVEIGRSGRVYGRDEMFFGNSEPYDIGATLPLPDFQARWLSYDVALVTYRSEVRDDGDVSFGMRSSIWCRQSGAWTLRFHQGTPSSGC